MRARRRGGEVGLAGTSATATPSGTHTSERICEHSGVIEVHQHLEQRPNLAAYQGPVSRGSRPGQGSTAFCSAEHRAGDDRAIGGSAEDDVS